MTGVDNATYKMRRSSKKVVIAEPGKNTTYTLNDEGLAIRIESTDGETATIEYEDGSIYTFTDDQLAAVLEP